MHIIFGLGLGYLFKEFCENSKGLVIMYEPNLEVLKVVFEIVDFSQELFRKNVKVASDLEELRELFQKYYKYKADVDFTYLNSYGLIYQREIKQLFEELKELDESCLEEFNTLRNRGFEYANSVVLNLENTLNATPLGVFKDVYKGKTAVVVSAGPTLDDNVEIIKKNRDKFVLFVSEQRSKH